MLPQRACLKVSKLQLHAAPAREPESVNHIRQERHCLSSLRQLSTPGASLPELSASTI